MAKLSWIIFGIFIVCCSAHFGFDRNENFLQRQRFSPFQRTPRNFQTPFGDQDPARPKCYTLARRLFYVSRYINYPCNRQRPGLPVIRWFMAPIGPICVSYIREPVYKYYKIPLCCPGFAMDQNRRCTIRLNRNVQQQQQQQQPSTNEQMMAAASKMREAMWQRAREEMARRRRAMVLLNMKDRMQENIRENMREKRPVMMPKVQLRRPPMAPVFNMFNRQRMQEQPRVAFLRFNRPTPPMPHPVQQPPLSGRVVKIIKRKLIPMFALSRKFFSLPKPRDRIRPPMVPRLVLSNRMMGQQMNRMKAFHPPMPIPRMLPRIPPQLINNREENMPPTEEEPQTTDVQTNGFGDNADQHNTDGFNFQVPNPEEALASEMQVDLPTDPVQMPDLVVEQAPTHDQQESCIVKLESAVKTCLKQNNIDVPDVMSAFEPFNDDKSRVLCEAEEAIFNCISESLKQCTSPSDADIAQDMLLETAQTVQNMCAMRQGADVPVSVPETSPRQQEPSVQGADTMATVENVDAIPTDVKEAATPGDKEEIIIEQGPAPSAEAVKEAIQHEVHVQEMRMKEYLLPILVGSGIGFMVLVLLLSLMVCCCCKRKYRRKMKLAKELEKPPLKDGIYTIGIPPPTYETNGIPPMYYEEAKGEKITSRSPSVLEGQAQAQEAEEES